MNLKPQKILLYGKGKAFDILINQSNFLHFIIDIVAVVDKNINNNEQFFVMGKSIQTINLDEIYLYDWDKIIITSTKYYEEIREELLQKAICREDIILNMEDYLVNIFVHLYEKEGRCLLAEGADIGGPSNIFSGIYKIAQKCDIINYASNNVWGKIDKEFIFKEKKLGKLIINDATDLNKINDNQYNFILSSNNLEHIANPIKALKEWKRVLKADGILVLVVPNSKWTFDHKRKAVSFSHLLEDYENEVKESDLSHLDEILKYHDISMDIPAGTWEKFRERSLNNADNRCLHHHVFEHKVLEESAKYLDMEIIMSGIIYKGNNIIILKKHL